MPKRSDQLRQIADDFGVRFDERGYTLAVLNEINLKDFWICHRGTRREVTNHFSWIEDGVTVAFFDFSSGVSIKTGWNERGGYDSLTFRSLQTVLHFTVPKLSLPRFRLYPNSFWNKAARLLGSKDIDIESHPDFSRKCRLRGSDENRIRKMFDDTLVHFVGAQTKISIEGLGNHFVVYRMKAIVQPSEFKNHVSQGMQLCDLMRRYVH